MELMTYCDKFVALMIDSYRRSYVAKLS